jgi:Rrf2 family iron-sulfur cluster assembly transcriptional regulator
MKITTRGRYAVTAILDVALHGRAGPVPLADISVRQGIPRPYLEQLFQTLRQRGLVNSTRGPGGGYRLARDDNRISMAEVITAVGEPMDMTRCGGLENCQDNNPCLTHYLWADLNDQVRQYLEGVTVADALRRRATRTVAQRQDLRFGELRNLAHSPEQEATL